MGSNMIIKLKKKNLRVLSKEILTIQLLFFFFIIFFGCKYDPVTMIPMTPEEICTYMNEHFEGDFELLYSKSEDNNEEKTNSAYMKCSLFEDREILTKHGYENSVFGWRKTFLTNYNDIYYRADVEKAYSVLIENWFGSFEYKYVNTTISFLGDLKRFESFDDYLKSSPLIYYTVVINAKHESMKEYALIKAKSVYFDIHNRCEYPLRLNLYLWGDDDFDSLTEEAIANFGSDEDKYFYKDNSLENYSQ